MTKNKNGVQGLIGLERFTRFGVKTDKAELAFFSVEPTNISVRRKNTSSYDVIEYHTRPRNTGIGLLRVF